MNNLRDIDINIPTYNAMRATIEENDEIRRAARWSLAFEIGKMLMARGAWCPKLSPLNDNYADLITALGIEFEKLDNKLEAAE